MAKWLPKEIRKLESLAPFATRKELRKAFPKRSWDSIAKAFKRYGFPQGYLEYDINPSEDIQQEIDKQKNKLIKGQYNKLISRLALQERVVDEVASVVTTLKPTSVPKKIYVPPTSPYEEALVLEISDVHLGETVDLEETGGLTEYNFDIFLMDIQFMVDFIVDEVENKLRKGRNVQDLHLHFLGDMITGDIFEDLVATADMNIIHATFGGALVLAQAIRDLAGHFRTIYIDGVVGNHGRVSKQKRFKEKYVNWDYVLYNYIAALLKDQKNVECNFPFSFYMKKNILGHLHLLLHGDNIQSYRSIPWYGIQRMISQFRDLVGSQGEYIEYVNLGHFHNAGTLDSVRGEIILNGSFKGGDEYSLGKMNTISEPKQQLYLIHPKRGKSWQCGINFRFAPDYVDIDSVRYNYDKTEQFTKQIKEF